MRGRRWEKVQALASVVTFVLVKGRAASKVLTVDCGCLVTLSQRSGLAVR
jgi:hypothetical protein